MMRAILLASLLGATAAHAGFMLAAAPAPAAAEIQYANKEFEKDWHQEWKHGDFPSYKKTYSEDTFPGRAAVVAAEDTQSDGKPGVSGLEGANVGAYLKHHEDGRIER